MKIKMMVVLCIITKINDQNFLKVQTKTRNHNSKTTRTLYTPVHVLNLEKLMEGDKDCSVTGFEFVVQNKQTQKSLCTVQQSIWPSILQHSVMPYNVV